TASSWNLLGTRWPLHHGGRRGSDPSPIAPHRDVLVRLHSGRGPREGPQPGVEAARPRFRPIVMTSFTFILGVVPLMVATGAGAASQQSIGTVVFGCMLASTLLAIPFVPVFYVLLERIHERRKRGKAPQSPALGG